MSDLRQEDLRRRLRELGFDEVRFGAVTPVAGEGLRDWIGGGLQAGMTWMDRTVEKRLDPGLVLPEAKSIIMLGVNYLGPAAPSEADPPGKRPVWARYALHEDYHDTIKPALAAAGRLLEETCGVSGEDYRYYTDTGPVLERGWAAQAGLGFIGKNAMLISRTHGNWLLLAAILTRLEFSPDEPVRRRTEAFADPGALCGKCTRCLAACPTAAFPAPGIVDSRRCISYHTIENKGVIPRAFREAIGARIFGCDVCLEVCPWNRFARAGRRLLLVARDDIGDLPLAEILALTPERFAEVFRRTPVKRLKLAGLLRNACIAAGNSGDAGLLPVLVGLAADAPPLVRVHAVWAVHRLGGGGALGAARAGETDPEVRAEYAWWDASLSRQK